MGLYMMHGWKRVQADWSAPELVDLRKGLAVRTELSTGAWSLHK